MQANVLGTLEGDAVQDVRSIGSAGSTDKGAMTAQADPCFGWRCPGCRSCHSPKIDTCPVCDTMKHPLVPYHVERALTEALANALNPLEDPHSLFPTVHVKAVLEALKKLRS